MVLVLVELAVATLLLFFYWKLGFGRSSRIPKGLKDIPGPKGLPIIGNIHQLGEIPNKQYTKWCREYGPLYKVQMGGQTLVVVSDPKLSREIYSDPVYSGKPSFPHMGLHEGEAKIGMFASEGEPWEVHRRFLLRQLRDFGFGKSAMESLIMDEVNEMLDTLSVQIGQPIEGFKDRLTLAVVNSLWRIVTNSRFRQDDPQLKRLTILTTEAFDDVVKKSGLLLFLPWVRHIFPTLSGYKPLRSVINENKANFERTVAEHKTNFQNDDLKDYIDVFLAEVEKTTDPSSPFFGAKAERFLISELFDLFQAGSDTSAATINWLIFYLCKNPGAQEKFQEEISRVTGDTRKVSIHDRPRMPFTQALIDETLRHSSLVPDAVPHRAMVDKDFHGFYIPKDTWVQPNLYFIHHDPKIWGENADEFEPERFLSRDGTKYERSDNLQAFMVGKRQCVGEQLARETIFLFATNLFQQFSMKFDPDSKEPGEDIIAGFFRMPEPFKIVMTGRFQS